MAARTIMGNSSRQFQQHRLLSPGDFYRRLPRGLI